MKGLFTLFFIASLTLALVDENKPAGDIAESKKTDITIKTDKGQSIKINTDKLNNQVFGRSTRGVLSRRSHFGRKAQGGKEEELTGDQVTNEEVTGEQAPTMEKDGDSQEESASSETVEDVLSEVEGLDDAKVEGVVDGVLEEEISLGDLADNAGTILDNAQKNENGNFVFTLAQVETLKAAVDALESLIEIAPDSAADKVEVDIPETVVDQGVKDETAVVEEDAADEPATVAAEEEEREVARRRHRRFRRHAMVKRFAHRFHSHGFNRKQFVKARPHNHHRWVVHP